MSLISKSRGATLALAAAGLVGCAGMAPDKMAMTKTANASGNVHCYGVNKCKGHNDCKSAGNSCKGQSSCKGQGFISMSPAACDHVGGSVGA
ncbi:MAG: hypothetical protein WA888_09540 [Burkholderiaceae bacterium]